MDAYYLDATRASGRSARPVHPHMRRAFLLRPIRIRAGLLPGLVLAALFATGTPLWSQVNIEALRASTDSLGWSGSAGLDASAWTGNTSVALLSGNVRINQNGGGRYLFLVLKGEYGWNDGAAFSDAGLAHLRLVLTASEDMRVEFFTQTDYNKKRLLLFRALAGAGLRFHILTDSALTLRYGIGAMFENERFRLPSTAGHPIHPQEARATSYLSAHLTLSGTAHLASIVYYQPALRDVSDFRILSENTLSVTLSRLLELSVAFTFRHDNHPPDGIKPLDTFTDVGFTIKW